MNPLLLKQIPSLRKAPTSQNPSPVLQLLAADAHGPLITLGDAHLVTAALHLLAGVLGGVQGCRDTGSAHRITAREPRSLKPHF